MPDRNYSVSLEDGSTWTVTSKIPLSRQQQIDTARAMRAKKKPFVGRTLPPDLSNRGNGQQQRRGVSIATPGQGLKRQANGTNTQPFAGQVGAFDPIASLGQQPGKGGPSLDANAWQSVLQAQPVNPLSQRLQVQPQQKKPRVNLATAGKGRKKRNDLLTTRDYENYFRNYRAFPEPADLPDDPVQAMLASRNPVARQVAARMSHHDDHPLIHKLATDVSHFNTELGNQLENGVLPYTSPVWPFLPKYVKRPVAQALARADPVTGGTELLLASVDDPWGTTVGIGKGYSDIWTPKQPGETAEQFKERKVASAIQWVGTALPFLRSRGKLPGGKAVVLSNVVQTNAEAFRVLREAPQTPEVVGARQSLARYAAQSTQAAEVTPTAVQPTPAAFSRVSSPREVVKFARTYTKPSGTKHQIIVGEGLHPLALDEAQRHGIDLRGYNRLTMDSDAVRHVENRHGLRGTGNHGGQDPITPEDYAWLPHVLADPDRVIYQGASRRGWHVFGYLKTVNGTLFVVEEVRSPRTKTMALLSMRKWPSDKPLPKGFWQGPPAPQSPVTRSGPPPVLPKALGSGKKRSSSAP
ncbi:MAG: hypothetical protein QOJ65_1209 [Fimbriimonadaceae bacterium]|jgi:hypothetical protein|nr:hypothetical protein [Fimbriimonadaceae bacterium]